MGKSGKTGGVGRAGGGKVVMRQVGGVKGKRPEMPINSAESNISADKQAYLVHWAMLIGAVAATAAIFLWSCGQVYTAVTSNPLNWVSLIFGLIGLVITFFFGRSGIWMSFFVPIMLAAKGKGWASQESLSRKAIATSKLFPAGGSTAALMLVQSLVSRGQFEEAQTIGEEQWAKHAPGAKYDENLAPLYSALGMAHQMQGDFKQCILWNDRAIESFNKALDNLVAKKTIVAKLASLQGAQVTGNIKVQLTVAHFNNASCYFNLQNHRLAKSNFQKAVDLGQQSPDFPEKSDLMRFSREQLGRLKHV